MIILADFGALKWVATYMAVIAAPGERPMIATVDEVDGPPAFNSRLDCEEHVRWASALIRSILRDRRFPDYRIVIEVRGFCESRER